jgi:prolyl 4-hydroxylase
LNDAYEGGETYFSKLDKKIKPETGKLVIWNNLLPNGKNRPSSFHCGLPVEFGTKYIAVIWIGSPLNEYVPFEDMLKLC